MTSMHRRCLAFLSVLSLMLLGHTACADQIHYVTVDTSLLAADYTGPFGLDFELVGSNGNTVTISNFVFGAGSTGPGSAFLTGGASGDLGTSVALADSANFFSDFNQQFTPGDTLSFTVDTTLIAPPSGGTPDNFSMVIFSGYDPSNGYSPYTGLGGTPIPTNDPSGNDTFFNVNIGGQGQSVASAYSSSTGDVSISFTTNAVPEPSSLALTSVGMASLLAAIGWRRRRP